MSHPREKPIEINLGDRFQTKIRLKDYRGATIRIETWKSPVTGLRRKMAEIRWPDQTLKMDLFEPKGLAQYESNASIEKRAKEFIREYEKKSV